MKNTKIALKGFRNLILLSVIIIGVLISHVNCESMDNGSIQDREGVNINLNSSPDMLRIINPNLDPDYVINRIELPVSEGITSPGKSIHPEILIKNEGKTDPESTGLEINAYLNDTPLTCVSVMINPPAGNEEKSYSLVYQIPEFMEFGRYKLHLVLDPENRTKDINTSNNLASPGGIISITPPDDDTFIGCEACWKNYR